MSLDARVRYTKKVILDSFYELLQEKPFHKITLKEVCDLSGINRTTFYRHYRDIYDWKEQLENLCIERTTDILKECDADNLREIVLRQFQAMKENPELYALLSSPNLESDVLEIVLSMILESAGGRVREYVDGSDDPRAYWDIYFLVHGFLGVIDCWIKNGMRESPDELADYYDEQFRRLIMSKDHKKVAKEEPPRRKLLR